MWVRKVYQERKLKGEFHLLIKEMMLQDHALFFAYFHMSSTKYDQILAIMTPRLQKCSEKRESICPSERLSVALRYLFTGDAQTTIAASFRISPSSIGRVIYENKNAIWESLVAEYLPCPSLECEWKNIAHGFEKSGSLITVLVLLTANILLCKHLQDQDRLFSIIKKLIPLY